MGKRLSMAVLSGLLLGLAAGCESLILPTGKYENDRGDFAVVYNDLIFIRLKAPENVPGALSFWEWAGKYSVDRGSHELKLDMPSETERLWRYSYSIRSERGGIAVSDSGENKRFMLRYRPPELREKPRYVPQPVGSDGVDPIYQPMAPRR